MKFFMLAIVLTLFAYKLPANERPAHYQGATVTDAASALSVLKTANQELALLLASELDAYSMNEVHKLTYTLENALAYLAAATDEIKEVLEEVHLGSETMDVQRVQNNGTYYLQLAQALFP